MAAGDGLVSMKPSSIAHSGTSASINADGGVDFTAVTSLSLNGVFTSEIDNYLVVTYFVTSSTSLLGSLRLRSGGSDNSASNYAFQYLDISTTFKNAARSTSQDFSYFHLGGDYTSGVTAHFYGPALAQPTAWRTITNKGDSVNPSQWFDSANTHSASTSFDGFTIYHASVNFTGNVHVFGYEE